jgi:phage shock protein PspC (stress-responsive transcriptional regulator)
MPSTTSTQNESKHWKKSRSNRVIDGVCAGLAEHLNVDPALVRIGWLMAVLFHGLGLIAYIAAMILVPASDQEVKDPSLKKKRSAPLIVGMILIAFAFLLILRELPWYHEWFRFRSFPFVPYHWMGFRYDLWPVLLIAAGIGYLVYAIRSSEKGETDQSDSKNREAKRWFRSETDRKIGGVCGGLAKLYRVDPMILRVIVAAVALATHVVLWLVVYLILMVVLPVESDK